MRLASDQPRDRVEPAAARVAVGRAAGESASREGIAGGRAQGEADLGPVKYLTTPVGADNEMSCDRSFSRSRFRRSTKADA
jgi:hypothetical protein